MKKAQIGVIGAGWWATFAHIPAIKSHPHAELIAVLSRNREKAEKISRDFGAKYACSTIDEILSIQEMDSVIIASTPNVHYSQAKMALEHGKHVLIEKPMTFTVSEAQELVDIAKRKNLVLLVSCPWHYTSHSIEARKQIQSGCIGDIKMISILMTNPLDKLLRGINTTPTFGLDNVYIQPQNGSYNDPSIAGGGQIYCQVSHVGAYLSFLTGSRPSEVFAHLDWDGSPNDIYNSILIKMENGAYVSLASTCATPLCERNYEIRIYGTKAILLMELWRGTMEMIDFNDKRTCFPKLIESETYPAASPAINFINTIVGTESNGSPGEFGLAAMEIIQAACESSTQFKNIKIR